MGNGYPVVVPSLIFFILDVFVVFGARKFKDKRERVFFYMSIAATVVQCISALGYADEYGLINIPDCVMFLLFVVMFTEMSVVFLCWFRYLIYSIIGRDIENAYLKICCALPVFAVFFLCCMSYSNQWIFYIDIDGSYQRGTFFLLQVLIPYCYVLMSVILVTVLFKRDKLAVYKRLIKFSILFLFSSHMGGVLQLFIKTGGYTQIGISLGVIAMFFQLYADEIAENERLKIVAQKTEILEDENTELNQTKAKLESTLEEYSRINNKLSVQRSIAACAGLGIWGITLFDEGEPRLTSDDKMRELLGVEDNLTEEQEYAYWFNRIVPEDLDTVIASVEEMRKGAFSENTYRWIHPTKGEIYVRCGGIKVVDNDDSIVLGGYHSDVDEIVREEKAQKKELEKAKRDAEAANSAKTTFLSNMSHDIRTPMNAILGYTNLIDPNNVDPIKINDYLFKIKQSGEYLLDIINNILEVSKIDSGKATIDECFTDLYDDNNNVMNLLKEEADRKNITFKAKMQIVHRYVFADMVKIREINMNIFSNAIKYTPNGGNISMYFREEKSDRPGYAKYVNVISDDGIGMSREYITHLFDSFSRERNSTESKIGGTGLGMSIVKKLVDLMGGTIEVESEPGKGTTFTVTMEHRIIDEPEKYLEQQTSKNEMLNLEGHRILLAEDNDFNAEIAGELIGRLGAEIIRVKDGIECIDVLDKMQAGYFDLILMDVQMPNLGGYEATVRIRELGDELKSNIPIVAMTADAFDEDRRRAFEAGMNGYIAKPFKMDIVIKEIAKVLRIETI